MGKPCYGSPMIRSRTIRMAAALLPAIFTASCATTQGNSVAETETVAAYLARIAPKAGADAFRSTFSDLNGDGTFEAIIYLSAPGNCGSSGCSLLILTPEDGRYREVTRMSVSRLPVRQLGSMTNGWHDLGVTIGRGRRRARRSLDAVRRECLSAQSHDAAGGTGQRGGCGPAGPAELIRIAQAVKNSRRPSGPVVSSIRVSYTSLRSAASSVVAEGPFATTRPVFSTSTSSAIRAA